MNLEGILIAGIIVGVTGLIIGILLGVASKVFAVPVNEKEIAIREVLPGSNCGGCGFAGCDACAKAIAEGNAKPSACPVGGENVAKEIGNILGIQVEVVKKVAAIKCNGNCNVAGDKYEYYGSISCVDAIGVNGGGPKKCSYGCLGLGSCVNVCEFGALNIVDGIAVVDRDKCTACGMCTKVCPKHLIEIVPYDSEYQVICNNKDKGKDVKSVCSVGCIGCGLCAKNCEYNAIILEDNLARIDYDKCQNCGKCYEKCPVKIINKY